MLYMMKNPMIALTLLLSGTPASDYVLVYRAYRYVVNGSLECGAERANERFGDANTILHYNEVLRRFELRLVARVEAGFYETLVVYILYSITSNVILLDNRENSKFARRDPMEGRRTFQKDSVAYQVKVHIVIK